LEKLYPQVLDAIVIPMMETHDIHAITWVGKSRVGKSTVSKTIAFNISAYQIVKNKRDDLKPSMVTGKKD
jgi:phage terminase large subunit GpA-like protein